jgi:hypothetical protein
MLSVIRFEPSLHPLSIQWLRSKVANREEKRAEEKMKKRKSGATRIRKWRGNFDSRSLVLHITSPFRKKKFREGNSN